MSNHRKTETVDEFLKDLGPDSEGFSPDFKNAFLKLCNEFGCDRDSLKFYLQLLANDEYHSLDNVKTAPGFTRAELDKIGKVASDSVQQLIQLATTITELKKTPLIRFLNEQGSFPKGDLLGGLYFVEAESLRTQAEHLRKQLQGVIDLPQLTRKHTGPQKYPDRKEVLVMLMKYVYDCVRNERALGRLLCPILMEILPAGATVLNKSNAPVSADGLRHWYRLNVKPEENAGTHNS